MTILTPKSNAGSAVAYRRGHAIRLAAGVTCPHQHGHELDADVVERIGNGVELRCARCRCELVMIPNDTRI